jgi:hypothetical protein
VPTAPLANVSLAGETVRGKERVPARLTVGRLLAALSLKVSGRPRAPGVVWANAGEPGTRRQSKRTVPPRNRFVPYFAGLKLLLWK